jgi:hypothetical protein
MLMLVRVLLTLNISLSKKDQVKSNYKAVMEAAVLLAL